ncbi:phage major capsid protein [Streptomyces sp. NPDC006655]|uniref:phage major capsid protein n=1 Tax=Streptomyces sp. NPDC006655 TaxID=3156898 RepID=UPI003454623D
MTDGAHLYSRVFALDDIQIRAGGDGRTVTAYAAVFDSPAHIVDQDGEYDEQIGRSAFDKTIQERAGKIGVFYNHARTLHGTPSERGSVPIGTPLEVRADGRGLLTVTRYNKTALADDVLESIRNGDITGQSFTGRFIKSDPRGPYLPNRSTGQRTLVTRQEIALIEYGPTPIPAYADAAIVGVRAADGALDGASRSAIPVHHTSLVDTAWDGPAAVARLKPDDQKNWLKVFAWYNSSASDADNDDGLPDAKDAWKLPHHEVSADGTPGPANLHAVRDALSRLPQSDIPERDRAAVEAHLQAHLDDAKKSTSSGGSTPSTSTPAAPAAAGAASGRATTPAGAAPEPHTHSATTTNRSTRQDRNMPDERMTVEERTARQSEIRARLAEIDNEHSGATLPEDVQTEWDTISDEYASHDRAIEAANARAEQLRALAGQPGATERVDLTAGTRSTGSRQSPAFHRRPENIYDLAEVRQQARSIDELPALYRDRAMRAIEVSAYPGAEDREAAQSRAAHLLDTVDDEDGTLARRMLTTGSPLYSRAFGKLVMKLNANALSAEESRALSLGVDASGGYAVPFQLDPTVILTSDGAINPLRQIARVEQITGKVWEGVTSAGVTVTRGAEGDEAADNSPTLAQPSVGTERVQGFVPFTVELQRSWAALSSEMTALLQDAKDIEEASSFVLGDGTGTNAGGVIGTLPSGSKVGQVGSAGVLTVPDDVFNIEQSLGARFRPKASWLANKAIYNKIRSAAQSKAGLAGDIWARLGGGMPPELAGYPAYEATAMDGTIESSGAGANLVLLFGDFKKAFLIVDRIGMSIELVPHLFGPNRRPTGQRGIYAIWSNNSKILVPNALRCLNVVSPT